ncbi:MAG: ATP-binding protein [Bacteroidota bacterium]
MRKNRSTSFTRDKSQKPNSAETRPLHAMDTYSKEELYRKVQFLMSENQQIKHQQQRKVNELLHVMEQQDQQPKEEQEAFLRNTYTDKDEFADLVSAAHIIQKDIFEAIHKFGQLEQQIEQRTRELAHKEANLSAIIENTQDIIFSVDKFLKILITNSAARKLSMKLMNMEMQPGVSLRRVLPEALLDEWIPKFRTALEGTPCQEIFTTALWGEPQIFQYSLNPILDADEAIVGVSFFCKDITQQETVRDDKVRQEQLLSSINYSIKEGIFRTSREDGMIYINKSFVDMFGYDSVEEMMSMDLDDLYVNPSRRLDFHRIMSEKNEFTNEEILFKRKDGSTFRVLLSSIKSVDEKTGKVYFDGAVRDITELNETKNQLQKQNEELRKVNQELDSFVYSTSHDLRAPLVSIKGLIDISRMTDSQEERERYLNLMESSILKLDNFIRDIIGYSRNSRLQIKRESINFESLIDGSLESLAYLKERQFVTHKLEVSLSSPFYSDPTRLEIICNNILSNAIRYCDRTKSDSYLHISVTETDEDHILFKFSDNGIGVHQKYMDKIFDMFYRGTQVGHGSGIGLYIVKEATEKLGGSVWVESVEGEGSTFYIQLPRVVPEIVADM